MGINLEQSGGGGGALPSGTQNQVLATPNGSSGQAALRALVQSDMPSMLDLVASLPNAKIVNARNTFTTPGNAANCDIYTCPSGRRAIVGFPILVQNTGASASTFFPQVKISGSYQHLNTVSSSLGAASLGSVFVEGPYIMEAGEILSLSQTTSTIFTATALIIEFDNTAPLRSVKIAGTPANGDTVLYTPSGSKNGFICGNPFTGAVQSVGGWAVAAITSGSGTYTLNYWPSGTSASSSATRLTLSVAIIAGATAPTIPIVAIANGDSLAINYAISALIVTSYLFWINIIEF